VLPFQFFDTRVHRWGYWYFTAKCHMTISDTAAQRINGLCEDKPGYGLKIQVRAGGCSGLVLKMEITLPTEKDKVMSITEPSLY